MTDENLRKPEAVRRKGYAEADVRLYRIGALCDDPVWVVQARPVRLRGIGKPRIDLPLAAAARASEPTALHRAV